VKINPASGGLDGFRAQIGTVGCAATAARSALLIFAAHNHKLAAAKLASVLKARFKTLFVN